MLTKLANIEYVPAVPEVPPRPAYTQCVGGPGPGHWETVCDEVCAPVGEDPYSGGTIYHCWPVFCRSEWVVTGPPTPVVCTDYPEQPHVPGVPSRVEVTPYMEWNAGANSIAELDGDVRVAFTQGRVVGCLVGFTDDRAVVANVDRYSHAFYFFQTAGGQPRFRVREGAGNVLGEVPYVAGDMFEIRRVGGQVQYLHNGTRIRRSPAASVGALSVGTALYATGDAAP